MPLDIAIAAIIVAIGATIVVFYLQSNRALEGGFDPDDVVRKIADVHSGYEAERVVFDSAGHGALVLPTKPGAPVGLVWQSRRKAVVEMLSDNTFKSFEISGPELTIKTRAIGFRRLHFLIDDPNDLEDLRKALTAA